MKEKLIAKLKLDDRSLSWFWVHHINKKCSIKYSTFMNQLDGRGNMRDDVEKVINEFIGGDDGI